MPVTARTAVAALLLTFAAVDLAGATVAQGQSVSPSAPCQLSPAVSPATSGIHAPFDALVRALVRDGKVDYRCLQRHAATLDEYLATLGRTDAGSLSHDEALALWINAYNAFTIKLILSRYPQIESIKDIPRRWDRRDWVVGGRRYSLNDMEHEILRKRFVEPRIHFAIVCASTSCPKLASEAYVAGRLDEQLTRAAVDFLSDPGRGFRLDVERSGEYGARVRLYLSSIFKWFREDFESRTGSLIDFVAPYVSQQDRAVLRRHRDDVSIRFLPYDWSLNDSRPPAP